MLLELFPFVILNNAMAFVYAYIQCLDGPLLTVTLRGVSNKHCLLPLFHFCSKTYCDIYCGYLTCYLNLCFNKKIRWRRGGLVLERRTPEREVGGFDPHSERRVLSLSKIHSPPKSTGNTKVSVAPSRHDRTIID